jgi:hypothetical protein
MILEHQSPKDNILPAGRAKNKKILLIASLAILAIGFLISLYSPTIFQEGNPLPQIKGIIQLTFGDTDIVQLSGSDNTFMTESKNGTTIHNFMKDRGYEFTEQMGSGYFFKSPTGQNAIATHRYYTRHYSLWTITKNNSTPEYNNTLWTATTTARGVAFQYPKELLAQYISETEWPPQVKIENKKFVCASSGNEIQQGGKTEMRMVDSREYCVTKQSEGAAGSVYTTYTYTFAHDDQTGVIDFVLRFVQCKNYDDPQMSECENERSAFDIDSIIDRVARTITHISQ